MDCNRLDNTARTIIASWSGQITVQSNKLHALALSTWQNYVANSRPVPQQEVEALRILRGMAVRMLDYQFARRVPGGGGASVNESKQYLSCVNASAVLALRKSTCEAYAVEYGQDPATWLDMWAEVWPGVPAPAYVAPPITAAQRNTAQVNKDLKAVNALVSAATLVIEKQDIRAAKKLVTEAQALLNDGSGTMYVHAALVGGKAPAGVSADRFNQLSASAKSLRNLVAQLVSLSQERLTIGTAFGLGPAADPQVAPPPPPDVVSTGQEVGLVDRACAWAKEHPWITVAGLSGAAYLAWRQWGKR